MLIIRQHIFYYVLSIVVLSCLGSCDNDFDVNAPWEENSIVYGLLDLGDSIHYIRLQKAYLGYENALETAQNGDSLFHPVPPLVQITETDSTGAEITYELTRIPAETHSLYKEEGIFAQQPYYLFTFSRQLYSNSFYELNIKTDKGNELSAQTDIVGNMRIIRPGDSTPINIHPDYKLIWLAGDNGYVNEVDWYFHYYDWFTTAKDSLYHTELKTIKWNIISNYKSTTNLKQLSYTIPEGKCLDFLSNVIPNDSNVVRRTFVSMDFVFHTGNKTFDEFSAVQRAQFNITTTQALEKYSNINGGLGIFASVRTSILKNVPALPHFINEIACNKKTKYLKFATDPSHPNYPNCDE